MNYPTYVMINGERFDINTSFKVAIECDSIARDTNIGDLERALAVIYKLFGEKGLNSPQHYETLLEKAKKYLSCGEELEQVTEEPDMDLCEDYDLIETSFMSDFQIDLSTEDMHWWKFHKLLGGLSNSDFGNCCILNRVRNLRNMKLSEISDPKERAKIQKLKSQFALKRNDPKYHLTKEQEESIRRIDELTRKRE